MDIIRKVNESKLYYIVWMKYKYCLLNNFLLKTTYFNFNLISIVKSVLVNQLAVVFCSKKTNFANLYKNYFALLKKKFNVNFSVQHKWIGVRKAQHHFCTGLHFSLQWNFSKECHFSTEWHFSMECHLPAIITFK